MTARIDEQGRGGAAPIGEGGGITRRRMIGYLIAAPTLMAGARFLAPEEAAAQSPSVGITDLQDLSDVLTYAALPTMGLLAVTIGSDGVARFELPRSENGQGLTTSIAMVIADELDLPLDKVKVTLAPARPERLYNQLTGGSNTIHAIYEPLRLAAAIARGALLSAAAVRLGVLQGDLRTVAGEVVAGDGRRVGYGELAEKAAVLKTIVAKPQLQRAANLKLTGSEVGRVDARDIVTGKKRFAMDMKIGEATPTMLCRAPTLNATALAIENADAVRRMPGVQFVELIPHDEFVQGGVAVGARTFGQCIDAIRALQVRWSRGSADGLSDADVRKELQANELPMTPALPGKAIEETFTFYFRPGDPLETNTAVADVRSDGAEVWSAMKSPILAQEQIASMLGLSPSAVKAHVIEGGGSFGRRLFCDAALEAAAVSAKVKKPVRLQWHRTDSFRHGRVHGMCTNKVRGVISGGRVVGFDQRHTAVETDFTHGLGELFSAVAVKLPEANFTSFSQTVFYFTADNPYNVGAGTPLLNEVYTYDTFNTSSVRNVYSPDTATSREVMIDRLAKELGKDPLDFRISVAKDERTKAVLQRVKEESGWGRRLPAGVTQGVAVHREYKSRAACVVELDTRPATVDRKVRDALTGPRVTKLTYVVDVGKPINVLGIKAQIMGGAMDGIAQALTYSLHLKDGLFLEGSWDNAFYTRQWNVPPELKVIVLPATTDEPGGCGELGVAAAMGATANAYAKATGKMPTEFPILHNRSDLGFDPQPRVPPIPQAPTNGLTRFGVRPAVKKKPATKAPKRRPTSKSKTGGS
jgi:isoquinoline 1-oxidoreductase beta subunit